MSGVVTELEHQCEKLRGAGVPIRTWCGLRVLRENPRTVALTYGVEVGRFGATPASLNAWPVDPKNQPAGIAIAAKRSLRLIDDELGQPA